jgi:hypothetical protein
LSTLLCAQLVELFKAPKKKICTHILPFRASSTSVESSKTAKKKNQRPDIAVKYLLLQCLRRHLFFKPSLADLRNARTVISIAVVSVNDHNYIRRASLSCNAVGKLDLAVGFREGLP